MRDERWLTAAGFALTIAGAVLAAVATTTTWIATGLRRDLRGILDLEFRGLDLVEGIVALVVAAVTLMGLVLLRRLRGSARVGIAVGVFACGLVLAGSLWWGPGGSRLSGPVNRVVRPLSRSLVRWAVAWVLVLAAGIGAGALATQQGTDWAPIGSPLSRLR